MRLLLALMAFSLCMVCDARADPVLTLPEVSLGTSPLLSFHGELAEHESAALITVPADQEFIITAVQLGNVVFQILQDDVVVLDRAQLYFEYMKKGISRIVIQGGTTLSIKYAIHDSTPTHRYFVQGYLAAAGGPHRFASGETSSTTPVTIFDNDTDRTFVVRSLINTSMFCPVYVDGEVVVPGRNFGTYESAGQQDAAFTNRRGGLILDAGSVLELGAQPGSEATCKYLMEGEYITP